MPGLVTASFFIQLTDAAVRPPRLGQLFHLRWRQDCASAPSFGISVGQTLI